MRQDIFSLVIHSVEMSMCFFDNLLSNLRYSSEMKSSALNNKTDYKKKNINGVIMSIRSEHTKGKMV